MEYREFVIVLGCIGAGMTLSACDGGPVDEHSSMASSSSVVAVASSSSQQVISSSGDQSSDSSSSLGIGECPPDFNNSPSEVAVMDIELQAANHDIAWRDFSLQVVMPRLTVAQQKLEKPKSYWAISFSFFPKAHACSLPSVYLASYVQSIEIAAIQGDARIYLTPEMNAVNTGENWLLEGGDIGQTYLLSDWNGLSKETYLGVGYYGSGSSFEVDTELTLSFHRAPPMLNEEVQLEVSATFNDGTVITRSTGPMTLR